MSCRTRILLGVLCAQTAVVLIVVLLLADLLLARGQVAVELAHSSQENRAEVARLGGTPIGPPPEQILRGDPGPPGERGSAGEAGAPGLDGRDGRDGKDATPEQVAAAVAAYMKAHPLPTAASGRDGRDGADGHSPACMAEPDECRGATGPQGPAGQDGANGQPPSAWLWTDPATKVSYECRRAAGTADTAPVYACAPVT